jgi:AcrR family transcriptional regulator
VERVTAVPDDAQTSVATEANEPAWRQRAVSRSLDAARSRAEERVQRFLDAAFALMDEKGTTDFTIQEVIDRSQQSLRAFYQYFDGKDELLLALFEDSTLESATDLREAVDAESAPLARLRAFTIRLHEWCEPSGTPRRRGGHNRRPLSEFSVQLAVAHPERVEASMEPISRLLLELVEAAAAAGVITVADTRRSTALVQQTVMYSWFGNRLIQDPRMRLTAEETWEFCLHGLEG